MFEQAAGELRAKLMGSGGAWPDNESTRRAHISDLAPLVWRAPEGPEGTAGLRADAQARVSTPSPTGVEGAGGTGGHGRASRSTTPSEARVWRSRGRPGPPAPRTPAAPQATTRSMGGSQQRRLAGGPPPTGTPSDLAHRSGRHNKTARPHWGRAAVAVALGFEPRVAVTPHSISSAAPSAARTRYLTRILYYMDPHRAQIDREVWDQGHTTSQDHTAARNTGTTSACRTVENKIK